MSLLVWIDGRTVEDTERVMDTIHEKLRRIMADTQMLTQAVNDLNASIAMAITEVEQLLTQPSPDVTAAVQALGDMKANLDAETQKVHDANNPPATP
jgi:methyl-accepting chemotaxis protein